MSPIELKERVGSFNTIVNNGKRIGVSEFARSKTWRAELENTGCFEVVDRSGTIGYMMSAQYAEALSERITELENEIEQASIQELFMLRSSYSAPLGGQALTDAALKAFDANETTIREFLDADR